MEQQYQKVNKAMNSLFEIQDRHMASFSGDTLPDLENQSAERKEAMNHLQDQVNAFISAVEKDTGSEAQSMMQFFNQRITTLLEQNRTIENRVKAVKDSIGKSMKQLSKGRKGLQSYRPPSLSVQNRPRVINFSE
ncbi:MAG: hypothetical protein R6V41_05435 [Desulfobacteraceae bacterium]